ncbi:MAG: T9SS C-terminal target domain-containing protein [Ignavibacteriae bacterium]|nr:MAG: T9SS C-terminal target domain-containing protein [Ignavibacteriota bacterium]
MKKIKTLLIILLMAAEIILLNGNVYAQVNQEWVRTYNSSYGIIVNDMEIDALGNIYVIGTIWTENENTNFITIKYNTAGVQQWVSTYNWPGGNSIDAAIAVAVDKSGNVYVTGYSEQTGWLTDAYCTIKYNSSGVLQWTARYKYTENMSDDPSAIVIGKNGDVYVTGTSETAYNKSDYCTIKYDSHGDSVWVRRYNGEADKRDQANDLYVDKFDNVFVTGGAFDGYYHRSTTIKYNSLGEQVWLSKVSGATSSGGGKIALDTLTNDIYISGAINNPGDYLLVKYNSSGVQQWLKTYNSAGYNDDDYIWDMAIDNNHNIYVTGINFSPGAYTTIKYNSNGDTLWNKVFLRNQSEITKPHLDIDKYANVYITGNMWTGSEYVFSNIKYNTNGIQEWLMTYPGGGAEIKVNTNLDVIVTGRSPGVITTIKYSQVDGIIPKSTEIPNSFFLQQNFPNPFNNTTVITYNIQYPSYISLKIYNMLGNEIEKLIEGKQNPGTYQINWNADKYSSGIYFYQIIVKPENYLINIITETKKMILTK